MQVEICSNCEKPIGKLEQACLFNGKVVCQDCNNSLRVANQEIVRANVEPVVVQQRVRTGPTCQHCGGALVKKTISKGNIKGLMLGLIFVFIGIGLCFTLVGIVIGIPLIIIGLLTGGKRKKVLKCSTCGGVFDRE